MTSSGIFAQWQPIYAQRGIATFPCTETRAPAVRNYHRFGLPASAALTSRFSAASALGFMCGKRSGITPLDIDCKDERVLADALDRHGKTPVVVRSGSGNFQAWYKYNGERRQIRPRPELPIDILGGGFVVAPPSHVEKGKYQFMHGSLDDLDRLPVLQNLNLAQTPIFGDSSAELADKREGDGRNSALFRLLGRAAQQVDDRDQLLDYARTKNEQCVEPMEDTEVVKIVNSVWKMQTEDRNRFGQHGGYAALGLVKQLAPTNPDALALYIVLKAHNGPHSTFPIANAMADTAIGLGRYRLVHARRLLLELALVRQVSPQTQHRPALYRWPKGQGAESEQ